MDSRFADTVDAALVLHWIDWRNLILGKSGHLNFAKTGVAVGTEVASRPPHRSLRAELLHKAPASGIDAKPLGRIWVLLTCVWQIHSDKTFEPFPSHPVPLASASDRLHPETTNFFTKLVQPIQVVRHSMVVEISSHYRAKPSSNHVQRFMHSSFQSVPDRLQLRTQSLLDRETHDLEPACSSCSATVGESEEVKRFRLVESTTLTPNCRPPPELDQPRLLRV